MSTGYPDEPNYADPDMPWKESEPELTREDLEQIMKYQFQEQREKKNIMGGDAYKEQRQCLCCGKKIEFHYDDMCPSDTGIIEIQFPYGSRYDQCHGFTGRKKECLAVGDEIHNLLARDKITAFVCDDCFEEKLKHFSGYDIEKTWKETRVI